MERPRGRQGYPGRGGVFRFLVPARVARDERLADWRRLGRCRPGGGGQAFRNFRLRGLRGDDGLGADPRRDAPSNVLLSKPGPLLRAGGHSFGDSGGTSFAEGRVREWCAEALALSRQIRVGPRNTGVPALLLPRLCSTKALRFAVFINEMLPEASEVGAHGRSPGGRNYYPHFAGVVG